MTKAYSGISRIIISPVKIVNPATMAEFDSHGIWDTGATSSCITKNMASRLALIKVGETKVKGVHGIKDNVSVFAIKIILNNENVTFTLAVTECDQLLDDNSAELLIGMDVISQGDFIISNLNQTVMTFRVPSLQRFDFVQANKNSTPIIAQKLPSRNDLCHCGSGKKFKKCHGL